MTDQYYNLHDVTGQESGVVIYPDGNAIICNWLVGSGVPIVDPLGIGLIQQGPITAAEYAGTTDTARWFADHPDTTIQYDANNDWPDLHQAGLTAYLWTVTANGQTVTVLAPQDWN